jgi:sugar phosphate isomerase/epimerase
MLAIQENLLPGKSAAEKFRRARDFGFQGIELSIDEHLSERLPEIAAASEVTGVRISALHAGHTRLIHPEYAIRDAALVAMRQAMSAAVDLGAQGVVFKPFYDPHPVLPDLHPYKSALELEAELLVTQLRATLCDLAYALGTELLLQPANHRETHLVRRVEHGAVIRQKLDYHPHLKVAASLYHMTEEGEIPEITLRQFANDIGYLYLSTTGDEAAAFARTAIELGYSGWMTLECGKLREDEALTCGIEMLRQAGLL